MDTRVKVLSFCSNDSTSEYKIIQLSAVIAAEYRFADVNSNLCSSQELITKLCVIIWIIISSRKMWQHCI